MQRPFKKLTNGLFTVAMVFFAMPMMAGVPASETTAQVPLDTTWILAIAGILLGLYKIHAMQKAALGAKSA